MRIALGLVAAGALLLPMPPAGAATAFKVTSNAYAAGATMPHALSYNGYGCTGDNASPDLHWSGAPVGTRSFALAMWDPDAPHPGGWWHWVAFDIPASARGLSSSAGDPKKSLVPSGAVQATNDFKSTGYDGPCPPVGDKPHRYVLTLYALNLARVAHAGPATTGPELQSRIKGHVLASAVLIGRFGR